MTKFRASSLCGFITYELDSSQIRIRRELIGVIDTQAEIPFGLLTDEYEEFLIDNFGAIRRLLNWRNIIAIAGFIYLIATLIPSDPIVCIFLATLLAVLEFASFIFLRGVSDQFVFKFVGGDLAFSIPQSVQADSREFFNQLISEIRETNSNTIFQISNQVFDDNPIRWNGAVDSGSVRLSNDVVTVLRRRCFQTKTSKHSIVSLLPNYWVYQYPQPLMLAFIFAAFFTISVWGLSLWTGGIDISSMNSLALLLLSVMFVLFAVGHRQSVFAYTFQYSSGREAFCLFGFGQKSQTTKEFANYLCKKIRGSRKDETEQ